MQADGGVGIFLHAFLTSVLEGGEWLASRPGHFTPEGCPGTLCVGDRVDHRAGLDALKKIEIYILLFEKYHTMTVNFLHTTGSDCPVDQEIPCNGK